jgi:hypothetical protein
MHVSSTTATARTDAAKRRPVKKETGDDEDNEQVKSFCQTTKKRMITLLAQRARERIKKE